MPPFQAKPDSPRHLLNNAQPQQDDMSPGRKKPVCQKCGTLMAGHKRPYGIPICPVDGSATPRSQSPAPFDNESAADPTDSPPPPLVASYIKPRMASPAFAFDPSASGYFHRKNPNWIDPTPTADPLAEIPERHGSWISTESGSGPSHSPARRQLPPARRRSVIDVDAGITEWNGGHTQGSPQCQDEEDEHRFREDRSDTQSNASNRSTPTLLKRMSRGLSMVIGRSTPLASLYSSPGDQVSAITDAAAAEGLYTRVVHTAGVKPEPVTPTRATPTSNLTRNNSWWVAVGRDRGAVDALVDAQSPSKPVRRLDTLVSEFDGPYNVEAGLDRERNERVGTFPADPRYIRPTFLDTIFAGAIGGFVVFYCLSSL